jgi:hypothetical protein
MHRGDIPLRMGAGFTRESEAATTTFVIIVAGMLFHALLPVVDSIIPTEGDVRFITEHPTREYQITTQPIAR